MGYFDIYEDSAQFFISAAFNILEAHTRISIYPNYSNTSMSVSLTGPYELRINPKGQLYLVKYDESLPKGFAIIGHAFNSKHSQIACIGKLLSIYLNNLLIDDV